jgi:hypothetical protein
LHQAMNPVRCKYKITLRRDLNNLFRFLPIPNGFFFNLTR